MMSAVKKGVETVTFGHLTIMTIAIVRKNFGLFNKEKHISSF